MFGARHMPFSPCAWPKSAVCPAGRNCGTYPPVPFEQLLSDSAPEPPPVLACTLLLDLVATLYGFGGLLLHRRTSQNTTAATASRPPAGANNQIGGGQTQHTSDTTYLVL